jgi:hypothetical protein
MKAMDRHRDALLYEPDMSISSFIPDWLPWWAVLALLVPLALYVLAFLAMPFSVIGLKGRLESLEARLDEIQGEVRALSLRLPERGMYLSEAPAPRPPIPPSAHEAPRPRLRPVPEPPAREAPAREAEARHRTRETWDDRREDAPPAPDPSAPPARQPYRSSPLRSEPRLDPPGRITPRLDPRRTDDREPGADWPR